MTSEMENTFIIKGKRCKLTLDRSGLSWHLLDSVQGKFRVPPAEIISCWSCPKGSVKCCPLRGDGGTVTCPEKESSTGDNGWNKLTKSNIVPASSVAECNSSFDNATYETNDGVGQNSINLESNTNNKSSTPPRHSDYSQVVVTNEQFADVAISGEKRGNVDLFLKPCLHHKKGNKMPVLVIELCERVLPSPLLASCRGETMVSTWRPRQLLFQHRSDDTVRSWLRNIWELVAGLTNRPRHLLVIVNPISGTKNAEQLYLSEVAPLLQRAAVRVTYRKTTHSGHAQKLAEDAAHAGDVDGVVTVSGDGTACEAATGLLKAAAHQHGVPYDRSDTALPQSTVALGIIPGGSTNTFIAACHGTEDVVTSVLQIIMGNRRHVDVGGVYVQNRLKELSILGVHAGYLGGLHETSVKLRHLGPIRDIYSGVKEFFLNRSYNCQVQYKADEKVKQLLQGQVCQVNCPTCWAPPQPDGTSDKGSDRWVEIRGDYHNISICLSSSECRYTKYGLSPLYHVGNGYFDLVLSPKSSRPRSLLRLIRTGLTKDHLTKNNVEAIRSSELYFRGRSTPQNVDGELRYYPEFVFKMHRQRLLVYSRGREPLSSLDLSTVSNNF